MDQQALSCMRNSINIIHYSATVCLDGVENFVLCFCTGLVELSLVASSRCPPDAFSAVGLCLAGCMLTQT